MGAVATAANIVLGVFNMYMLLRSRRVSLMVVPTIPLEGPALAEDRDTYEIRIQVANLSEFPVYVSEVGLKPRDRNDAAIKFAAPEGRDFAIELKARESVRLLPANNDDMRVALGRFCCAYARTECGRTRTGTSPSLQQQELNVLEHTRATSDDLAKLRKRHTRERVVSYVRSVFW